MWLAKTSQPPEDASWEDVDERQRQLGWKGDTNSLATRRGSAGSCESRTQEPQNQAPEKKLKEPVQLELCWDAGWRSRHHSQRLNVQTSSCLWDPTLLPAAPQDLGPYRIQEQWTEDCCGWRESSSWSGVSRLAKSLTGEYWQLCTSLSAASSC